jgi:hypothetical protein
MPGHAGFAAAITYRQRVLNDSVLVAYHAGETSHEFAGPVPDGPPDAAVDFFLEAPRVRCVGDDPDRFLVLLSGWGDLALLWNGVLESRKVRCNIQFLLHPRFVLVGTDLTLRAQSDDVTLDEWDFEVFSGGAYPADADLYLRSESFRNRLEKALKFAVAAGLFTLPPISVDFLGPIVATANMATAARVVAGSLILGIDVTSPLVSTMGNPELLADFARDNDLAMITHPDAAPTMLQQGLTLLADEVAKNGATLEPPKITLEEGRFRIAARASNADGSVTFSLAVLPVMFHQRPSGFFPTTKGAIIIKPRAWAALDFKPAEVSVEIDPDLSVLQIVGRILSDIFTLGVFELMLKSMIDAAEDLIARQIEDADLQSPVPRVRRLEPKNEGGPVTRLEIREFEIHEDGLFTGITLRPEPKPPALIGLTSIPLNVVDNAIKYEVRLPLELLPDDPNLKVRWTIVDRSSGNVLLLSDGLANGRLEFEFVPGAVGPGVSLFNVLCRVYRTLGPYITDFFNDGIRLKVGPAIPTGSYVRWRYDVKTPRLRLEQSPERWSYLGDSVVGRSSALHRIDRPCKMVDRRSRYVHSTEFLNELPFPLVEITQPRRRRELCEYCFFGGPGKLLPAL